MESPISVCRQLSLTQAGRSKLISTGLALVIGIKTRSLDVLLQYFMCHLKFVHSEARMPSSAKLFNRFRAAGTNECLDLSLSLGAHPRTYLKDHAKYGHGPGIYGKPRRVSFLLEKSAGWVPESMGKWSVGMGHRHPVIIRKT